MRVRSFSSETTVTVRRHEFGLRSATLLVGMAILVGTCARAAEDTVEQRLRKDVNFLASDQCEGRGVTTRGINLAADYIVSEFKQAGLKPGGPANSYFQSFSMPAGAATLGSPNTLRLHGPHGQTVELKVDEDFRPLGLSGAGKVSAPLVFAGFGATGIGIKFDDYQGIDVTGKMVIIVRRTPRMQADADGKLTDPFDKTFQEHHAALATKMVNAELHKAAAVLFVSDRLMAKDGDPLMDFAATAEGSSPSSLPAVHVHRAAIDKLLKNSLGIDLAGREAEIEGDLKPHSASLTGWTADLAVAVRHPAASVKNIIGVAEGTGPLAKETVIIGAHYDHLGYGGRTSLARSKEPAIHHGADDNGSGTTVLMELGRHYGALAGRQGRRLVFVAFSGEESGLLGSEYYCKNPMFPLADTVAMINMDMVGRLRQDKTSKKEKLIVYGTGTGSQLAALMDEVNRKYGMQQQKVAGASVASDRSTSDHASFYAKKIPVLFFFTGNHPDYHRPSDTADKINVSGMHRIEQLLVDVIDRLAQERARPTYVRVIDSSGSGHVHLSGRIPRLGIRPSYGDEGEGLLLDGVSEQGPAEKAGLKEGDRIVELGGQPVKNLDAYMVLIARHRKGEPLDVGILRDGKKQSVRVTPE